MSGASLALLLVFEACILLALFHARRLWRGQPSNFDDRPVRMLRALPFQLASGALLVALGVALGVAGDTERATVTSAILVCAFFGVLAAGILVTRTLKRSGRPRALVPPPLRDLAGAATYRAPQSGARADRPLTLDEAEAIARAEAERRGWGWSEPVRRRRMLRCYAFFTNAGFRGGNATIHVHRRTGKVTRAGFGPR